MFAPIHSKVSVDDLLHGVIIQSGNDACITLAEGIAGSEAKFAEMMTKRAREIGLPKSTFGNSNGLPNPRQLMTARELGKLARYIIQTYPDYYGLYGTREFTFNKIRQQNRNPLLALNIGVDGMKTGYIKEAGYGLVGSAVQNGMRLVVVVNGLKTAKDRADEAKKLLEWGFHNFQANVLFTEDQSIADAKVYGGARGSVPLVAERPVQLMVPRGVREKIIARVVYSGPVQAPVQKEQKIGVLKVWRNDVMVLEVPLQAAESVSTGNLPGRALDAASELFIGLFRAGIQRL
jgi:D-alanyl-D-alanine carboxypeptidase (penicillin-binding protein 5/6)